MNSSLSHLSCPRCSRQLHLAHVKGVSLHGCGGCGGLWLDNGSTNQVLARVCSEVTTMASLAAQNARQQVDLAGAIRCPECHRGLRRVPGGDPSLLVDICDEHGTWFDRDELQQVAALAERRRREQQRSAALAGVGAGVGLAGAAAAVAVEQNYSVSRALEGVGTALADTASAAGSVAVDAASTVGAAAVEVGGEVVVGAAVELVLEGICAVIGGIFEAL